MIETWLFNFYVFSPIKSTKPVNTCNTPVINNNYTEIDKIEYRHNPFADGLHIAAGNRSLNENVEKCKKTKRTIYELQKYSPL
jgi:hypothetical protein